MNIFKNIWYPIYNFIVVKFDLDISDKLFEYKKEQVNKKVTMDNSDIIRRMNTPQRVEDIKQLIDNVWNYSIAYLSHNNEFKTKHFIECVDNVRRVSNVMYNCGLLDVIGLQPMSGPVAESNILIYNDDNGFSRFVSNKYAVEANTRKFSHNVTVENSPDINSKQEYINFIVEIEHELLFDIIESSIPVKSLTFSRNTVSREMLEVSDKIAHDTKRGRGNFAIVSKQVSSWIFGEVTYRDTITYDGNSDGMRIYSVPLSYNLDSELCIIGYKDFSNEIDAGIFYFPYIPVLTSGKQMDPKTFEPIETYLTRYNKQLHPNKAYFQRIVDK